MRASFAILTVLTLASGCARQQLSEHDVILTLGAPSNVPIEEIRAAQTGSMICQNKLQAVQAVAGALQGNDMIIAESSGPLGVVTAAKERSARTVGQTAGAIATGLLLGAGAMHFDVTQTIRATALVSEPQSGRCTVRVGFERIIKDNRGFNRFEYVLDPPILQEFLARLPAGNA